MKLARLDNLERQDSLFMDGEPNNRYVNRQISSVVDAYDFEANDATDISSVTNWIKYYGKAESKEHAIVYMQGLITDWGTHDATEKDLFIQFALETINPSLTADQKSDIEAYAYVGFTIFTNGGSNTKQYWNGSTWV